MGKKNKLSSVTNDVRYETDTNDATTVYENTNFTKNSSTTTQTFELSLVKKNVTIYPDSNIREVTDMTTTKATTDAPTLTPTVTSVVSNVKIDPVTTELTSSTTDASHDTSTNVIPTATTLNRYVLGGGVIILFFSIILIYFACMRSKRRQRFV